MTFQVLDLSTPDCANCSQPVGEDPCTVHQMHGVEVWCQRCAQGLVACASAPFQEIELS